MADQPAVIAPASPLPWFTLGHSIHRDIDGSFAALVEIAKVKTRYVGPMRISAQEAAQNARYIVHCANLHPELLAIVRTVAHWQPVTEPEQAAISVIDRAIYAARHVLAKCEWRP